MKKIKALDTLTFGPGAVLELDADQAAARKRALKVREDGFYETLDHVQFKHGETFGYDGVIPKSMFEIVTADGKSIAPAKTEKPKGPVKFVMPAARDIPKDTPPKKKR